MPVYMWRVLEGRVVKEVKLNTVLSSAYMIDQEISSLIHRSLYGKDVFILCFGLLPIPLRRC